MLLVSGVLLHPLPGRAQPTHTAPAAPAPAEDQQLIVTIRANGIVRGEFTVLQKADGDYWVLAADLPRLKIEPRESARRQQGGEDYYSSRALGGGDVQFDEAELTLSLNFSAEGLEGSRIDLSNRPPPVAVGKPYNSLILSYRLSTQASAGSLSTSLDTDLNVRWGPVLLRQATRLDINDNQRRITRGSSQLIWDDRQNATRLVVGDAVSSAGAFGTTVAGGGLLFYKFYDLAPDTIRQPTASLQTSTILPAEVEVAVDGATISRTRVGPGPINIDNLLATSGARNIRVTVTDAAGRREVIERPFLFSDSVLAQGLHEYSYFLGKRSEAGTTGALTYREPVWQGFHRYGLTDSVTVSAGGEGSRAFTNLGAGLALRSDTLGIASLEALTSTDRAAGTRGQGWSARYTYLLPAATLILGRRQFGEGFRTFTTTATAPFLRSESRAALSTRLGSVTVSADWARSEDALDTRTTRVLRAAASISRGVSLNADYQTIRQEGRQTWAASVFLRMELDGGKWVGTTVRSAPSSHGLDMDAGKQLPAGEGVGYRLGVSANTQAGVNSAYSFATATWNTRPVSVDVFASAPVQGGGNWYSQLAISGALVGIDGSFGITRRVDDGFALARLGIPQPGVEIFMNNQLQGTTDASGKLFIPQVGSFGRQDVSINDKQISMEYNIREKRKTITPAYRSGTVVEFGGSKMRALVGMAWLERGGKRLPVEARAWQLTGPVGALKIETAGSGDFYLEDAPTGRYEGPLEVDGRRYMCKLNVPDFPEPVHESKEGIVCE